MLDRLKTLVRSTNGVLRIDGWILISFLFAAAALFVFAKLASEVLEGETMAFDRYLITLLRDPVDTAIPIGPRWLQTAMLDITAFGSVTALTVLTTIVAGYLLVVRKAATAAFVIGATVGGALLNTLLKAGFERPRPDIVAHLVEINTASFPSGHAMNSATVFLTLGALLARTQKSAGIRVYILAVAIMLTLVIGCSRVYLGVHWPSDVMAGWAVGAAWAAICSATARQLQRRRRLEPETSTLGA